MAVKKRSGLKRCPTGIQGFDEITFGGLPSARATIVCGGPGSGKTIFGVEFLVRGALEFGEAGVLVSFEERPQELAESVLSLDWNLDSLVENRRLAIEYIDTSSFLAYQSGDYDLEGLFIRIGHAIDSVGATRVVLDTLEALFSSGYDSTVLRHELERLFRWLKDRGVTAVVTAEQGQGALTRNGLEEYVSDCVIMLDQRVTEQLSTRRLRVVKYRGSPHGTNEFPFVIGKEGFVVVPITSAELQHKVSTEFISSGISEVDDMLGGKGFYQGSTVMISGSSGTGKSTFAAHFAKSAAENGSRCLYLAFEESTSQIVRNMAGMGIDLSGMLRDGSLMIHARRPTEYGLEGHLMMLYEEVKTYSPQVVVVDPITDFQSMGSNVEIKGLLMRIVDFLKSRGISALFTSIVREIDVDDPLLSSLIDSWIQLRNYSDGTERRRDMYILKSRGMWHSNKIREFQLTRRGVDLLQLPSEKPS